MPPSARYLAEGGIAAGNNGERRVRIGAELSTSVLAPILTPRPPFQTVIFCEGLR